MKRIKAFLFSGWGCLVLLLLVILALWWGNIITIPDANNVNVPMRKLNLDELEKHGLIHLLGEKEITLLYTNWISSQAVTAYCDENNIPYEMQLPTNEADYLSPRAPIIKIYYTVGNFNIKIKYTLSDDSVYIIDTSLVIEIPQ